MKSRLIIISALKMFFIWVVLHFFSFVPVANAQKEVKSFCNGKTSGYMADPNTRGEILRECEENKKIKNKNSEIQNSKGDELQKNKEYRIEVISNFIKSNIYYWGNFNCGPHKDTHPAFSNFISDVIVEGKSKIKMNWATGNRQLLLEIKKDGEVKLMGEEQSKGFRTYYRLSGNLDIEKNNIQLNGKKTDANNNLDRICDAVINFNNSPSVYMIAKLKNNITEKNSNDINSNQGANVSVVESQIEKIKIKDNSAKSAKEAETEKLTALEIEKNQLKEETEAKAKAAESNRFAYIEVEKKNQREAAEAKASADKVAKDVLKSFLNNNIHYYGVFSCGQRIDNTSSPVSSYNDNVSGDLQNGKSQISMSWGGNDPGKRNLDFTISHNGSMTLKGIEKSLKGITTSYNLNGNINIKNTQAELNGMKYDEKNSALRKCSLLINFMKSPEEYYSNLHANNNNDKKNDNLIEQQLNNIKTTGKTAKEAEIERLAALEIEKKRLKEEAEAKAKAAEANRMAAIEVEKQKQREAAEAKARADKAVKEAEIERLAALEIEKKRLKEEAEAKAKAVEANRLASIEAEKQKQREAAEAKARADKAAKETEIERLAALEIEKKRLKEEAEAKAKAVEANRLAAIEAEKQKQREAAEAKARADKAAKEAEIERLAALEIEKQKQKEAVAARVAAIEAEKQKQREIAEAKERLDREKEIERLAALEIEKKRIREEKEAAIKAETIRMAAIEAENKRQKEEAEARARAQRVIELENELKKLKTDFSQSKPLVQQRQENIRTDNDPLTAFEGAWASVSPPVFYLIFTKVSLGARQVSLPNIGQANIRLSDGTHGSNFQISAPNLNCYYFVSFTSNRQKMIMELKAGDSLCLQSSILERTE